MDLDALPDHEKKIETDDEEKLENNKSMFHTAIEITNKILDVEVPESWVCHEIGGNEV